MNSIDRFLNNITMYRLLVYSLSILSGLGIVFSFLGRVSSTPSHLVISLFLIVITAYVTDRGLGRLFGVPTNMETSLITSLILFLILQPAHNWSTALALVLAGAIASASKFILAWNGRHIFNPAALAAAVLSLTGLTATTWWVGSSVFWPFTLVIGLAIVRKIRRFALVGTFAVVGIVMQGILFLHVGQLNEANIKQTLIASPLIFLATVMLTEPATMPPRKALRVIFAALVAVLYVGGWKIGPLVIYPEVALLIGNLFAFAVTSKSRVRLKLIEIKQISDRVFDYVFQPDQHMKFLPGQYMEWTLAGVPYDSRGNRRTFTIASSPTEEHVHLGVKFYSPASTFKARLHDLQVGDVVYGSQLAGDFILGENQHKKIAFIAGGIGITPFRSMIKYLVDTQSQNDLVLLYVVSDPSEIAYKSDFVAAAKIGIKTIPIVTDPAKQVPGIISAQLDHKTIKQLIPDYNERIFYISGPNAMVEAGKHELKQLGITRRHIKTDHFSGY